MLHAMQKRLVDAWESRVRGPATGRYCLPKLTPKDEAVGIARTVMKYQAAGITITPSQKFGWMASGWRVFFPMVA